MDSAFPILAATSLERRFGAVIAVRDVSLTVGAGEVVLLAGSNGAGKSTLLRCVAGLSRPSRGEVLVAGRSLRGDPAARGMIGFLSHQTLLYDDLTARENLRFAAALHGLASPDTRVMDALNAAGLMQRADQRTGSLSHGTRQRLSVARATLHAPRLLLLDEPFSGLDAGASTLLRDRVSQLAASGCAILCVTHQPADIWSETTRTLLLDHGRLVADSPRTGTAIDFSARCQQQSAA